MVRGIVCMLTGVLSGAWYCVYVDRCTQWCVVLYVMTGVLSGAWYRACVMTGVLSGAWYFV